MPRGDFDFDAFTGCDLAPYREVKPARARAAGTLTSTRLPQGLRSAAWEVTAEGGPTGVTLAGPNGESVTVSRDTPVVQNDRFLAQLRQDGTTFVLVDKPAAGVWTLSDDGTSPVRLVREARGLPEPSVSAKVRGRGRARVLSWNMRRIPGQRVTFAEIGKDVRNAITTTKAVRGSVRFRPADGPGRQAPDRRARAAERPSPDHADRRLVPRAGNAPPRPAEGAEGTAQAIAPRGQLAAAAVRLPPRASTSGSRTAGASSGSSARSAAGSS